MAASMVNIADFRCRDSKPRVGEGPVPENRGKLRVVEAWSAVDDCEAETPEENPAVLAMGAARDNARMRQRIALHPVPTSRHRSNLVRFNEPRVAVMKIKGANAIESSGDCDFPPAA